MKVGDYVRTKDGRIEKYSGTNDSEIENFTLNEIIKSSPNIIDLIEVGDYVNGKRVEWIGFKMYQDNGKECKGIGDKIILFNEFTKDYIGKKDIKSIVTKEQFKKMEYKLDETI